MAGEDKVRPDRHIEKYHFSRLKHKYINYYIKSECHLVPLEYLPKTKLKVQNIYSW